MPGIEGKPPTEDQVARIRKEFQDDIAKNGKDIFDEQDINRVMSEDAYVHRWFMHKWDDKGDQMEACIKAMIAALKWRKDEKVREITADKLHPTLKQKGNLYMKNKDKDGCPLLVFAMAKHVKGELPQEMKQLFIYYLDRIDRQTNGGRLSLVFECVGCGVTNMDMEMIQFMIKCFEDYYPCNLNNILVIDMSWLLTACWKIIKGWLPPSGVKLIQFLTKSNLSDYISEDQQLKIWGGKDTWSYEFIDEN